MALPGDLNLAEAVDVGFRVPVKDFEGAVFTRCVVDSSDYTQRGSVVWGGLVYRYEHRDR